MRLARIEALVWYPLVALALFGLAGAWRMRRALAFPVLCGGGVLAMYGLTEGNLGTAFRHRGELVWVTLLLATVGIARLAALRQPSARAAPASGVGARQPVAERDVVLDRSAQPLVEAHDRRLVAKLVARDAQMSAIEWRDVAAPGAAA